MTAGWYTCAMLFGNDDAPEIAEGLVGVPTEGDAGGQGGGEAGGFPEGGEAGPAEGPSPEDLGPGEPETGSLGFPLRRPPVVMWKERNNFVRVCVSMGLSGPQISALSLSTPQPLRSSTKVYDKIQELHLEKLFQSPKIKRRRYGPHNKLIHDVFMKVAGQAWEYGCEVADVMRDEVPAPKARFRPDIGLQINGRQYYFEVQISRLEFTRWHAKLKHYVKLYEDTGEPFRVCLLLLDRPSVVRVRAYARVLLQEKHPNLNPFYFMTLGDFQTEWDVVRRPTWAWCWNPEKHFRLV